MNEERKKEGRKKGWRVIERREGVWEGRRGMREGRRERREGG